MSEFIFENPSSVARAEVQRVERSIIALRAQHEPSTARDEQEAALWAQHAELAAKIPSVEQRVAAVELAKLQQDQAALVVAAKINREQPNEAALADLTQKIEVARELARVVSEPESLDVAPVVVEESTPKPKSLLDRLFGPLS